MGLNKFPPNWDENRVRHALQHYETQSEEEAMIEDESVLENQTQAVMEIPLELVPIVRELIAKYYSDGKAAV